MQLNAVHTVRTKLNFIFPPISQEASNRFLPRVSHSMRRRIAHRRNEGIASSDWALLRYCVKTEKSWHSQGQDHGFKSDPPFFRGAFFSPLWSIISRELLIRLRSDLDDCASVDKNYTLKCLCRLWNLFVDSAMQNRWFSYLLWAFPRRRPASSETNCKSVTNTSSIWSTSS
jgi:hypothetical protein